MTILLKDVLDVFGYTDKDEQDAWIKFSIYRNFFPDRFKDKKISEITDKEVEELLNIPYPDLITGIEDWTKKADANWLRAGLRDKLESVGNADKKKDFINLERWLTQPEKLENKEGEIILQLAKALKLTGTVPWPEEEKIDLIFIHGALLQHVKERVNFISYIPESKKIDCIPHQADEKIVLLGTNPRFLDNTEAELFSEIVAKDIFGYTGDKLNNAIQVIKTVLDENKDFKTSNKNWLEDPQGLEQLILDRLGEKAHPINKNSSFYQNKKPYELSANNGPKPRALPRWLPTAVDMVNELLKKRALVEPEKLNNTRAVPIYSTPPGRVATTPDNFIDLLTLYDLRNITLLCISNNNNGLHYIEYQQIQAEETIAQFEKQHGKRNIKVITIGQGDENLVNVFNLFDVMAKILYAKKIRILESLKNNNQLKENKYETTMPIAEKAEIKPSPPLPIKQEKLYNNNGFFSPSQYATHAQPYGPYSDYYCHEQDPLVQKGIRLSK